MPTVLLQTKIPSIPMAATCVVLLTLCLSSVLFSCRTTITSRDGTRHLLPAVKDKLSASAIDTGRFILQRFSLADYTGKVPYKNGKRLVETLEGIDVAALANSGGRYLLYFWNCECPGTVDDIHKLDSLSQQGEHILVVSLRRNYKIIDSRLRKTGFSAYPCYTIESGKYPRILLQRQISFVREACPACYEQYKGDLAVAAYLLIDHGGIRPVIYNDSINVLRQ